MPLIASDYLYRITRGIGLDEGEGTQDEFADTPSSAQVLPPVRRYQSLGLASPELDRLHRLDF